MKRVRLLIAAAALALAGMTTAPVSACPHCDKHGAKCDCAKQGKKCNCGAKCTCGKKTEATPKK